MPGNNSIKEGMKHLILCEGRDEWNFLTELSKAFNNQYSIVQIENFGGNDNLRLALKTWSIDPNFRNLKSLIVVRDAERDANVAVDSIKSAFKNANLPVPPSPHQFETAEGGVKTGFVLFPKCSPELVNGTLEDLCLSILKEKNPPMSEIDAFISDLKANNRKITRDFKTKLHTYFSITDKFVSLKIGEAAKAGAFDWSSSELDQIKSFLGEMVS